MLLYLRIGGIRQHLALTTNGPVYVRARCGMSHLITLEGLVFGHADGQYVPELRGCFQYIERSRETQARGLRVW